MTYKLYTHNFQGLGNLKSYGWWLKVCDVANRKMARGDSLSEDNVGEIMGKKIYRAATDGGHHLGYYIVFDSEEEASLFLLRW